MEIWRRVESSVEPLALEKAVKNLMDTAEEGQQDRRQVCERFYFVNMNMKYLSLQVAATVLFILQETCSSPAALLHKLEILMNLVWERLNTGHWAKVTPSPLGRNTHWVLFNKCSLEDIYWVLFNK